MRPRLLRANASTHRGLSVKKKRGSPPKRVSPPPPLAVELNELLVIVLSKLLSRTTQVHTHSARILNLCQPIHFSLLLTLPDARLLKPCVCRPQQQQFIELFFPQLTALCVCVCIYTYIYVIHAFRLLCFISIHYICIYIYIRFIFN